MSDTPRTDALTSSLYYESCADAADMGPPARSPEKAYSLAIDLALDLERKLVEAREAIKDLFAMMDEHLLIRDTSKDADPDYHMRQLKFVGRLAKAQKALGEKERGDE